MSCKAYGIQSMKWEDTGTPGGKIHLELPNPKYPVLQQTMTIEIPINCDEYKYPMLPYISSTNPNWAIDQDCNCDIKKIQENILKSCPPRT